MAITTESYNGFTLAANASTVSGGKYTAPIHVLTFDGTASPHPRAISNTANNTGGGYPQLLAAMLVDADPAVWAWKPMGPPEYDPMYALKDCMGVTNLANASFNSIGPNLQNGVNSAIAYVNANPGKKFVLAGLSQGTLVTGPIYNEFRFGALQSRRADLLGVINFGCAVRPSGWTTPHYGVTQPTGTGAALFEMWQTYRQPSILPGRTGLIQNPEPLYWAFCQPNDAASAVSSIAAPLVRPMAYKLFYNADGGGTSAPLTVSGLFNYIFNTLAKRGVTTINTALAAILQWWPFATGNLPRNFGFIGFPNIPTPFPPSDAMNPHAQYHLPFVYKPLNNSSKTATQLAFEHLHSLGKRHTPIGTVTGPANNKPYQLYTFGKTGELFDSNTVQTAWPSLTSLGNSGVTADFGQANKSTVQTGPQTLVAAGVNAAKVEVVPVSYSSAAFPLRHPLEAATDRAVSMILASPSGTKFFLSGHGLGAAVALRVYDEFQNGRLAARKANLLGVYNFGNPTRPSGVFRGSTNPGGAGIAGATIGGRGGNPSVTSTPAPIPTSQTGLVWEFVVPGDPVATQASGQPATWANQAWQVMSRNTPVPAELQSSLTGQARAGAGAAIPVLQAKDIVAALFTNAGVHNTGYSSLIPFAATPTKTAVQLAVENINAKAV